MCEKNEESKSFEEVVCENERFQGKVEVVYTDSEGNEFVQ